MCAAMLAHNPNCFNYDIEEHYYPSDASQLVNPLTEDMIAEMMALEEAMKQKDS